MNNPWLNLPEAAPYVLPQDHQRIAAFNRTADEDTMIRLNMMPEPFLGNPIAPVVLLGLNPGFSPNAVRNETTEFLALSRNNLHHAGGEYPFYLLTPSLEVPGRQWWEGKLAHLIRAKGLRAVAQGLLCVEYFPYHSTRFAHARLSIPSQQYSFALVRDCMTRGAVIVIMRSERLWRAAIPELNHHRRCYRLQNPQNVVITANNCPAGYSEILAAL
jgi:hypothetical protein